MLETSRSSTVRLTVTELTHIPAKITALAREPQRQVKNLSIVSRFIAVATLVAGFALSATPAFAATTQVAPTATQVGAFITKVNPGLPNDLRQTYATQALAAAREAAIDPCLLIAVVSVESHWKAAAISPHGAIGLGQLKLQTAASLHANPYIAAENLRATSQYLRQLMDRFAGVGSINNAVAIAAYNAGPGAVERAHNQAPNASTATYVSRVLAVWGETRALIGQTVASVAIVPKKPNVVTTVFARFFTKAAPSVQEIHEAKETNYWGLDTNPQNSEKRAVQRISFVPFAP
jgi:soluble lytic murein transglycosylase-like protein